MNPAYEASLPALYEDVDRVVSRLEERGKVPQDVVIRGMTTADLHDVASLHACIFDDPLETIRRRFLGVDSAGIRYCHETSLVICLKKKIIGTALFLPPTEPTRILLFALIVSPQHRRGWVTPLLKKATFETAIKYGANTLTFHAHNMNMDTIRHARRVGARRAHELD